MQIASAKNDGVNFGRAFVAKMDGFAIDVGQNGPLRDGRGPLETHGFGAVGANDLCGPIFDGLQSQILG